MSNPIHITTQLTIVFRQDPYKYSTINDHIESFKRCKCTTKDLEEHFAQIQSMHRQATSAMLRQILDMRRQAILNYFVLRNNKQ
jgi:hypothetical protein